ncbi:MAG: NAD(P)H-dependent oxidoreductase [Oscillospiraceae bacterium]
MKICVINGSPKGNASVTLQTLLYLQNRFPECEFNFLDVGQKLRSFERDMTSARLAIESADILLFSYPVYTFMVPYQLHRFIELLKMQGLDLSGKFATQISTSKHFFDMTAHKFIEENCYDLGLKYIKGLSADMDDLLEAAGQQEALDFFKYLLFCVKNNLFETPPKNPAPTAPSYAPSLTLTPKSDRFDTVIVTNAEPNDRALSAMLTDFQAVYPYHSRIINIAEFPFVGGCLGCFNCASNGKCVYNDGFDTFLREKIQTASAIVYAFTVKDHSMGASFKIYDDRQFCNGHRTVNMGMPVGYLVSGDYAHEQNLQTIIEGRCEVARNFLAGVATNAAEICAMSDKLCYALENSLVLPQNFYGVGGMKIFRDLIYVMRGLMREDHKFYKEHGIYDFPQKKKGTIIKMQFVGLMMSNPKVRLKMRSKMNSAIVAPYKKVIEKNSGKK